MILKFNKMELFSLTLIVILAARVMPSNSSFLNDQSYYFDFHVDFRSGLYRSYLYDSLCLSEIVGQPELPRTMMRIRDNKALCD